MRLWDYIKEAMLRHPTCTVSEDGATMTYEELVVFAELFGRRIAGEACCAILCRAEMATAMALLGCFAAGVTAVPLSTRYGHLHCKKILNTVSPTAIITDVGGELQTICLEKPQYQQPETHPALIMCTSGTTGAPKGVMLSEENILCNVQDIAAYFDIGEDDRLLISRPLYHCAVLTGEFLTALLKGTAIRFLSAPFNPSLLCEVIRRYTVTAFCSTPTVLGMLSRLCGGEMPVKHLVVSGECLDVTTAVKLRHAFPHADIYHVYGLTEACPRVSFLPPRLFDTAPDAVGIPLRSVFLKIVKPDGSEAKAGETGVLWVKGKNVMCGYYNDPVLTAKALKKGWLCTGDMAMQDDTGLLKIKGRCDNLIIRAGMNIYPQEIEAALRKDLRTHEVLVYGVKNEKSGTQIAMKIVGAFPDVNAVKELCIACLPPFQIPSQIELVTELPKSGSGKTIRKKDTNANM